MKLLPPLCTDCAEQCLRYIQEYEGKQKDAEIQDSCAKCKDLDKHQNRSTNDCEIRYQPPTETESEPERHDTLPGTNKSIHTVSRIELNDRTYRTTGDEKIVLPVDCNRNLEFGKAIRQEFLLHEGSIFLNNGSYGAVPRRVHEYKTRLQRQMEAHPQKWFVHDFPRMLKESIDKVASFLGTEPDDTFLVQNVTKGCNTVIKSFPLKSGDAILINNLTYPAIANTAIHTAATTGAEVVTMEITFPIASEDELVDKFETVLRTNPNIKLAVIDHITSSTALLIPVKRLTEVCHRHGVIVLIDGAHAPGQLIVSFADVDADFYTGNFHKWGFTPRGCAVLWQNPKRKHDWFRPLVTSCEHGTTLQEEFGYEGVKDDTAYYSVTEGIDFMEALGGVERISEYNVTLMHEAFTFLSAKWGTSSIEIPDTMTAPFMKLLQLPELKDFGKSSESAAKLQRYILDQHSIDCKIYCRDQRLFCRLSVQIYNCMDDFRKLNMVIQELII